MGELLLVGLTNFVRPNTGKTNKIVHLVINRIWNYAWQQSHVLVQVWVPPLSFLKTISTSFSTYYLHLLFYILPKPPFLQSTCTYLYWVPPPPFQKNISTSFSTHHLHLLLYKPPPTPSQKNYLQFLSYKPPQTLSDYTHLLYYRLTPPPSLLSSSTSFSINYINPFTKWWPLFFFTKM